MAKVYIVLMEKVQRILADVYEELGGLHTEEAYQKAVEIELQKSSHLSFKSEYEIPVHYKGELITVYTTDFVVAKAEDSALFVELKSANNGRKGEDDMRRYLKSSRGVDKGLCAIFGPNRYYTNSFNIPQ